MTTTEPKLQTNLDTGFLKLVAILSMTMDHVGLAFFPQAAVFRWAGRLAFPLFSYCMVVGMLYTRDIKRYALRLAVFALLSQPFWILAFHADDVWGNLFNLNIFFSLLVNLVTTWAFKEKKWWLFAAGIVLLNLVNFDYAMGGVLLMLIFYLCRQRRWLAGLAFFLLYLPIPYAQPADPWPLQLGGWYFSFTVFSLLALPLILARTDFRPKVPRWLFYLYYPAHLLLLWLLQTAL